jgi:ribosomal protein S21
MENKKPYRKVRRDEMEISGNSLAVRVVNNQIELALKLFKRKIKDSGKLDIVKSKQEFLKPSVIKRKKRQDAIRKNSYNLDN